MPVWVPVIALCLAVAAGVTGLVLTRDRNPTVGPRPPSRHEWVVDELPLRTARDLEALAGTPEEKQTVHRAQRLADHEMDLAFNDALHSAAENPPALTPQTRALAEHKAQALAAVQTGEKRVAELTKQVAAAGVRDKEALEAQLDMAKAQVELDQDEVDQSGEALERLGADPQARIRRLQAAHAAMGNAPPVPAPAASLFQSDSLLGKAKAWTDLRAKVRRLDQAEQEARTKVQTLTRIRDKRAARVEQERAQRESAKQQARVADAQAKAGVVASLKHYMLDQRMLSDLGRRMQDEQDLAELYNGWGDLALAQQRAALHTLLQWVMAVLGVLVLVFLSDRLFERIFIRMVQGNKRVGRMLKVAKYAVLALGILAILFILFGPPSQATTLFGLAGAGLTVALKDFIVAFFGWFVLVGRNGIHVGDWVEINGVGGEVVEIGLLRTMLLETGNWSESGHPTGRIVSFVNSFAIEGHFFNFSTSGQWMWDELQVNVPPGRDPYQLLEAVRQRVEQATSANAALAETEWRKSVKARRAQAFSARAGVDLVPVAGALEIRIRYITRAYERHDVRRELNQALVELTRSEAPATVAP